MKKTKREYGQCRTVWKGWAARNNWTVWIAAAVLICVASAAEVASAAVSLMPGAAEESKESLFYQYLDEVLIPEYGLLESGLTTQMTAGEEHTEQWLWGGVASALVTDLDGDEEEECLVLLLESEVGAATLYMEVYEEEEGEVFLSAFKELDYIENTDWWLHGWNISLVDTGASSPGILFENCSWGNSSYATEIYMSVTYLEEEAYTVFQYDGASLETAYVFRQDGGASGGFAYLEEMYEDGEVVSERILYSSIPSDVYTDSEVNPVYSTYPEAMAYVAGLYGLTVNTELAGENGRYRPHMAESIFLDSENLTRVFSYSILTEDTESPYTYVQTFTDGTSREWVGNYEEADSVVASLSDEEALQGKLEELVETYGVFESGQSGTASDYVMSDWLNTSGILSAAILDLDLDGTMELQVCRTQQWTFNGYQYDKILIEVYEREGQSAVLADSLWFEPYSYSRKDETSFVHQYVALLNTESSKNAVTVSAVQMDGGYYLVCEYYTQGVLADGGYAATWVLEYQDETLQYVCSLENGEFGSSVETGFAYEFEDGVNTKTTMYYWPGSDISIWDGTYTDLQSWEETSGSVKTEFFANYGLNFTAAETEFDYSFDLFDGDDNHCEFSGTTSGASEALQLFRLLVKPTVSDYNSGTFVFEETLTRGNDLLGTENTASAENAGELADVSIVFETTYVLPDGSYGEFADITAYNAEGEIIWTYETDSYMPAELRRVYEIGLKGSNYYYVESGTVIALDALTGEVLWKNSDFGGSGFSAFTENAICLTGYYGPDFFAVSYDGTTLCSIDSFGTEYYWAAQIEIEDDLAVVSLNEGYHEARVNLETWEYWISY